MATVYGRARLRWNGYRLMIDRRQSGAQVVPDARWPGMWRVSFRGVLSDMTNRARVRDAAIALVLSDLNTKETRPEAA
jgi:hypothetical protein